MNKRNQDFFEVHKNGFKLLKVVTKLDRNLIPITLLQAILGAAIPYVTIILSAQIIDLLIQKYFHAGIRLSLIMIGTILGGELLLALLKYYGTVKQRLLQDRLEILIREKGMELDYSTMEDSEVLKAIRNAESAARYNGGLGTLVKIYGELLQYFLSSATAIVFTVIFCLSIPKGEGGILYVFSNPIITGSCLLLAWYLGMKLTGKQLKVVKSMLDEIANKHYIVENQLGYWFNQILLNVESAQTIRVNGMSQVVEDNIVKFTTQTTPLYESMGVADGKKILSEGLESSLFSIVAYLLVLAKVLAKAISIGSFTKYAGALVQFNTASNKLIWSEGEVNRITKNLVPLLDFLYRDNKMYTGSLNVEKREDNIYEIEFHDVGFKYPGSNEFSLQHVNLKLTLKNKMAVVGPNGAGKSTFIKLLCRLYDPTEGSITLNGIDIRKYNYEEYLKLFGVVFQDFHLFGFPINENVEVGNNFDNNKVENTLRKAGVWEFISRLKDGMDTVIEKGDETGIDLSGGQEQKISIARALYKDAPFVILDEPTAALDPISEAEIYERFNEMVEDKTSVYISHRMSSCRFCDEIIVFQNGGVKERGSHENLLKAQGLYYELWNAQAQYYA